MSDQEGQAMLAARGGTVAEQRYLHLIGAEGPRAPDEIDNPAVPLGQTEAVWFPAVARRLGPEPINDRRG